MGTNSATSVRPDPFRRQHADDLPRFASERHATTDDVRRAAEPALPEGVADHDHIGRVRLVIGSHQSTAHQWNDVNDVKEPLVDECNLDTLGIIETGEIGIAGLPEG